jgi:hypothetical protein
MDAHGRRPRAEARPEQDYTSSQDVQRQFGKF